MLDQRLKLVVRDGHARLDLAPSCASRASSGADSPRSMRREDPA